MVTQYQQVKQKADELFETYALTVPVRVFELADLLGIGWKSCSTSEITKIVSNLNLKEKTTDIARDILAFFDSKNKLLYLHDLNHPITRKRFTMAHEIGHHVLHSDSSDNHFRKVFWRQDIVSPVDKTEAEANYFAAYLLMPDKEINNLLPYSQIMIDGDEIVEKFAKIFAVSPEAMRIRLKTFKQENEEKWRQYDLDKTVF